MCFTEMELVYHRPIVPMTLPNTDPCGLPLASFSAEMPLVLRSAAELSSESRGVLRRGDKVVALDEAVHSGVRRTLVAFETSLQQPLGWVTREKHGKELLKTMRSSEGAHGFYSSIVGFEIFGRKSPPKGNGRTTLSDSLASRVARRRKFGKRQSRSHDVQRGLRLRSRIHSSRNSQMSWFRRRSRSRSW